MFSSVVWVNRVLGNPQQAPLTENQGILEYKLHQQSL